MKNMAKKLFIAAMCLSMSVTTIPAASGINILKPQTVAAAEKNGLYHEGSNWTTPSSSAA